MDAEGIVARDSGMALREREREREWFIQEGNRAQITSDHGRAEYNERRILEQKCCASCCDQYVTYGRSVCDVASSLVRPFEKERRCLPSVLEGCWDSDSDYCAGT